MVQAGHETLIERASRAETLARQSEAARDPLEFIGAVLRAQAEAAHQLESVEFSGVLARDVTRLLPAMRVVLHTIGDRAPEQLANEARTRRDEPEEVAISRLAVYWSGDISAREDYISRALLQPYVEVLRTRNASPDRLHRRGHCPFCGGAPIVSARRSMPDADSGFRMLVCSLCANEWSFNRGCCPACFEESPDKLPVYSSDAHPNVRIEACETCHRYVKSIDLTKDARPVPAVDDLVSIAMDLWAMEEGLTRIEVGLAGV